MNDWIAICETKASYCRLLDTRQWDAWSELFTQDLVPDTSGAGGPPPVHGREAAIASVCAVIETARTAHQVHTPEIAREGDTAHVVWAMQDRLTFDNGQNITGYAHDAETHVKQDGHWKISRCKLTRLLVDPSP